LLLFSVFCLALREYAEGENHYVDGRARSRDKFSV